MYNVFRNILSVILKFFFFYKVEGKENLPKDTGYILASNHKSNWDVIFVATGIRKTVHFIAKKELFENKILGWFLKEIGTFPIDRGKADMTAIKTTIKYLKDGEVIGMFPEGTRNRNDEDLKAKSGVAMFAIMGKSPIVPCYISGKYWPFFKMKFIIGKPIYLDEYYGKKNSTETFSEISDGVLEKIHQLDPNKTK